MNLIFDTSIIIALERKDKNVISLLSELSKEYPGPPQTTFITYYEFRIGINNRLPKNRFSALEFLHKFNCLPATEKTAEVLAQLKLKYGEKGIVLSLADLIIASHAKETNMTLITKDKAFDKIDDINKIVIS